MAWRKLKGGHSELRIELGKKNVNSNWRQSCQGVYPGRQVDNRVVATQEHRVQESLFFFFPDRKELSLFKHWWKGVSREEKKQRSESKPQKGERERHPTGAAGVSI